MHRCRQAEPQDIWTSCFSNVKFSKALTIVLCEASGRTFRKRWLGISQLCNVSINICTAVDKQSIWTSCFSNVKLFSKSLTIVLCETSGRTFRKSWLGISQLWKKQLLQTATFGEFANTPSDSKMTLTKPCQKHPKYNNLCPPPPHPFLTSSLWLHK